MGWLLLVRYIERIQLGMQLHFSLRPLFNSRVIDSVANSFVSTL